MLTVATAPLALPGPGLWIAVDRLPDRGDWEVVNDPPWLALQALAERLAHPRRPSAALTVSELSGRDRPPRKEDHTRQTHLIAARVVAGHRYPTVVLAGGSVLWRRALRLAPHPMLAANATTRLLWDLGRHPDAYVTATLARVGRRDVPDLPRAAQKGFS